MTYTGNFSIEDIREAIHRFDLICHPYIIYCHPSVKDKLKECLGDTQMIEDIPWMEEDKVIVMDRAKLEEESKLFFDSFVNVKDIGKELE